MELNAYGVFKFIGFTAISMLTNELVRRHKERKALKKAQKQAQIEAVPVAPHPLEWDILGIDPTDDMEEVKRAYRRLAHECHPDKHNGSKEKEERFKKINEAYQNIISRWS